MELLFRVSLCLMTFIGKTFGDEIGTEKISCKEDEDVILPCSFKETLTTKRFDWKKDGKDVLLYEIGKVQFLSLDEQFNHRVSLFPDQLNSGNASISIKKAQVSDRGNYTCLDIDSAKSYTIELTVGSFGKPSVQRLNTNNDWALLRCEVLDAYPKPTLVWYDSAGNKIVDKEPQWFKKEDHYDVTLEITVVETGVYTCEATQEEIHHQSNKTTSVYIEGNGTVILTAVVAGVIGIIAGAFCVAAFFYKKNRSGGEINASQPMLQQPHERP